MCRITIVGLIWLLMLGLFTASTAAQTVSGAGTKKCSVLLKAAEIESTAAIDSYLSWAQGFLSGYNWSDPGRRDVKIDHAGMLYWLMQYCDAHPQHEFYNAVQAMVNTHAR